MSRTLMLIATLLLSTAWLQAQNQYPQKGSASSGTTASVEGCLHGSNGSFTLTDSAGMIYQLRGKTSLLKEHNGHEVRITGVVSGPESGASASTMSSGSSAGSQEQTLTVKTLKHISKTCKMMGKQ